MSRTGLPGPVARLLERALPADRRDDVLGDLEASYAARRARRGPWRARMWLVLEAASLLLWSGRRRHTGPVGAPEAGSTKREVWTMGRDLLQDLRFATRTLARRPAFALTAVAVLGLGIGASVTVLTLVNRIFLEPPAGIEEPDRLIRVWRSWAPGQGGGSLSNPDFEYYRSLPGPLQGLAAWSGPQVAALSTGPGAAGQVEVVLTSDNWFGVLGVRPARGRFFTPGENASPDAEPVLVVSDGFWRGALGADPAAIGRTIELNGIPFTIVGVAPADFSGPSPFGAAPDAWAPIAQYGALLRASHTAWWERLPGMRSNWLSVVGRLAPGATFEAAVASLEAASDALDYEQRSDEEGVLVTREWLYSPSQAESLGRLSRMLLAVVGFVLAIAIANVAVLMLSRASTRNAEMVIRASLGAGRGRLARQLLAESLVLAFVGGTVGTLLAWAFSDAAASLLPYGFRGGFAPDARVSAAAVLISAVTAVAAGLGPALRTSRDGASGTPPSARVAGTRGRGRDALVVGQVVLSTVLVAGAVLFARSFLEARGQDLGFGTEDRLLLQVDLRAQGYSADDGRVFVGQALERLRALPGVAAVTTAAQIPFRGDWSTYLQPPPGAAPDAAGERIRVGLNTVSPEYFEVMGIEVVQGRPLGPEDLEGSAPVVVINETLAGTLWPGQSALGRTLPLEDDRAFTVVGVARDATYYELGEGPTTQLYSAAQQVWEPLVHFVVRTAGPAAEVARPAQAALREVEPSLAFGWVSTMESVFEDVTARYRVSALLVGVFGMLALVLAAAGLYGVLSFVVAQRTREIGVRMALGAERGRVAADVLRSGLRLALVGVGLGIVVAVALRGFTESLLFGVPPTDPWPLVVASTALVTVAALATFVPARRASRVEPLEAIRTE